MTTSTQTQLRRGTSTQNAAMTPVVGEAIVDNTNKRINVGDGSTAGGIPLANYTDIQNQKFNYGTVGGTGNAITLTNVPAALSYAAGQRFVFKATANNTSTTTVNVDGLGVKNIYKLSSGSLGALASGDIVSGVVYTLYYDGTQFQLGSGGGGGGGSGADRQTFTSSGTWTKPTGYASTCMVLVECWGGGGGGGTTGAPGGGGGGGSYKSRWLLLSSLGATETVTIGAGGTAGGSAGGNGGSTSLGTLVTAYGGTGGGAAGGAGGGFGSTATAGVGTNDTGGQGFSGVGGYETGGGGGKSSVGGVSVYGGGGGGSGNTQAGGVSQFGGNGGAGATGGATAGTQPGGGGGGANSSPGAGAAGKVVVTVIA